MAQVRSFWFFVAILSANAGCTAGMHRFELELGQGLAGQLTARFFEFELVGPDEFIQDRWYDGHLYEDENPVVDDRRTFWTKPGPVRIHIGVPAPDGDYWLHANYRCNGAPPPSSERGTSLCKERGVCRHRDVGVIDVFRDRGEWEVGLVWTDSNGSCARTVH